MAKVYVAGKFEETAAVRAAQQKLRDLGHEITHDWTQENSTGKEGDVLKAYLQKCAEQDYFGVFDADAVLLLNHPRCFGAMTELGLGLAWGRTIYVVGADLRRNIFYDLPEVRHFNTVDEAIAAIHEDDFVDMEG